MKSTRYSCPFLMKIENFFDRFSENTQISNFMKIPSVRTELLHVDRRTDGRTDIQTVMTKLIVAFYAILLNRLTNTYGKHILICCKLLFLA